MSPLDADQARQLAEQRGAMRRARSGGRRWYLRAAVMALAAGIALYRGGQVNALIGIVLLLLAVLSLSLGRSMRRGATEMERKITLMEQEKQ